MAFRIQCQCGAIYRSIEDHVCETEKRARAERVDQLPDVVNALHGETLERLADGAEPRKFGTRAPNGSFDRKSYMREYMRKRRAANPAAR